MKFLAAVFAFLLSGCAHQARAQGATPTQPTFLTNSGTLKRVGPYAFLHLESIDRDNTMAIIAGLQEAERQSLPVLLEIDSEGGGVPYGWLLAKVIERSEIKVRCMVDGNAFSMGLFFMAACDERVATARSNFMLHQPTVILDTRGFPEKILNEYEELASIWRTLCRSTSSYSKIPYETCMEKTKGGAQWFLDAHQALELGLIDEIVKPIRPLK